MKITNISDVFFDLDHTLWDFDKNSEITFGKILSNYHPSVQITEFIEKYVPINQACWKLYQFDKITHEELRYNRLKESFDAINYVITDAQISVIAEDYLTHLPDNNHLFDGAFEVLDYLNERYNLHIITNGFAAVQDRKIKNAQLEDYFLTITNSELAGVKKPNPVIFEYALDLAKAKKENSIMIGDSLEADVEGALNIGLDAIFFNESNVKVASNIKQVNHLLELKKYL
ncbi:MULTISPECIES: YjjG family noncanonical pyrimidine nucleotidase [unclassified Flavobacterium]|uniref:YjjG family noncanonical pyrimidine nucleotidase n=1 Tax=unclassified Flavobacterium TaxID=196869 RepID=UPI001570091D|nr:MULTISPECIES: YjjG family noncanonical pyrimidine nucleotidase [unclassified Flavobacterium]MBE0391959.1 Pyrimidine 5'-nucleotidase YjjG [Flavobacterium sp. PL002]NRT15038.1 putative hydrolase of the HAD superfamily [Flavobacterium sp. 28A]